MKDFRVVDRSNVLKYSIALIYYCVKYLSSFNS